MGKQHRVRAGIRAQKTAHLAGYRFGHSLALTGWGVFLVWATLLDALPRSDGIGQGVIVALSVVAIVGLAIARPRTGAVVMGIAGIAAAILLNGSLLFALLAITAPALFFSTTGLMIHPR